MNRLLMVTALAAATISTSATAALYKCTDAAGNTTYSEMPCPAAASEQRLQREDESLEKLLAQLHTIAFHRAAWDVEFLERTLGVRLKQAQGRDGTWYQFVSKPTGFPVEGGGYRIPSYGNQMLELRMAPGRCVTAEMIKKAFSLSVEEDRYLNHQLHSMGPFIFRVMGPYGFSGYTTNLSVMLNYDKKRSCAQTISLQQGYSGGGRYR
jgi:hypothetical protein